MNRDRDHDSGPEDSFTVYEKRENLNRAQRRAVKHGHKLQGGIGQISRPYQRSLEKRS